MKTNIIFCIEWASFGKGHDQTYNGYSLHSTELEAGNYIKEILKEQYYKIHTEVPTISIKVNSGPFPVEVNNKIYNLVMKENNIRYDEWEEKRYKELV